MSLTKVTYSMINGASVNVLDYGADSTGATDCTSAFQAAVTAAAGRPVVAKGTFKTSAIINLITGTNYDFRGATFFGSGATSYSLFGIIGCDNTTVFGGKYYAIPGITPPNPVHPTGTYYGGAFFVNNSTNIIITQTNISRMYGAIDIYNSSNCIIHHNNLSDNAGGIQGVSDDTYAGNKNITGLDFSHNIILHSGDDALTFLCRNTGTITESKICNNHVTKDAGINATIGLSKAVALYGTFGTAINAISGVVISGNTGYYMGAEFIRAQGILKSNFSNNSVRSYGLNASAGYWFGTSIGANGGLQDCVISGNVAYTPLAACPAIHFESSTRCSLVGNFCTASIGGAGTLAMLSSTSCVVNANNFANTLAYAIALDSGCSVNTIINNNVSVFATLSISDSGTTNIKSGNIGYISTNYAGNLVPAGATSRSVAHGLTTTSTTRVKVTITPTSSWYNSTKYWVSGYSNGSFTLTTDVAPSVNDFTFDFIATEV